MENYEIIDPLGSGAQGHVFKVRHKGTKKVYVMKKILCLDVKLKNKALEETKALMLLKHPNVCVHHDHFFARNEMKADEMCIIMDFYRYGDLQGVLTEKRKKQTNIGELVVKQWLAQLVHILSYIHANGVIHRDLKPSNVFISDTANLVIGDFGVASVQNEVRKLSAEKIGTLVWMAPEMLDGTDCDGRSDVWSLGCIAMELLTCRHFSDSDIHSRLIALRKDNSALEAMQKLIAQDYSSKIVDFVASMLQRNPKRRPSSVDLKKHPFIEECTQLLPPGWNQAPSKSSSSTVAGHGHAVALPIDKGPPGVLAYLRQHVLEERCVAAALSWLATRDDLKLDNAGEKAVIEALRRHAGSAAVCSPGTAICAAASRKVRMSSCLHTSAAVKPMLDAADRHSEDLEIQIAVASYHQNVSAYMNAPQLLGAHRGVQLLLTALQNFSAEPRLCVSAGHALHGLFSDQRNAEVAVKSGALELLCRCWRSHEGQPEVIAAMAAALVGLCGEDAILKAADEEELMLRIVRALSDFPSHHNVVHHAITLLESLCEDATLANSFLMIEEGISQLSRVLSKHPEEAQPLSQVLAKITSHNPILAKDQAIGIKSLAQAILKQSADRQNVQAIIRTCEEVLGKLPKG